MEGNEKDIELAGKLTQDVNEALNRRIEERFRAALFLANPTLDMAGVTVISNVANDDELIVGGVEDETIDKAMAIFESEK
ncbi:hypothetical protein [Spirosoma endbachense]|jgi:uncharacterized membrane protein|uniref:Uncharacterized protein n=1 Tax=Spirosoma endbachense TaxID=2666025 RepID=A0A6P1W5W3_9BACT|nr:hypothetical protein [Spirosoma endbachense]QHW00822.1 hypothetical protein GJR95_39910 [Spirosoma endbachense]